MKIAVTGHTQGIGREVALQLAALGHEVVGFSTSTGSDIERLDDFADALLACDALANVAFHPTAQTELLRRVVQAWRLNPNKTIVNVSSAVVWYPSGSPYHDQVVRPAKRALDAAARELALKSRCRISTVAFGMVDTEPTRLAFPKARKMPVEEAAALVVQHLTAKTWTLYALSMPR